MPKPFQRSSSFKKVYVRVPSGETRVRFERRRKKGKAHCAICRRALHGVHSERGAKTKNRPTRGYAGVLCPSCAETVLKYAVMLKAKAISLEQIPFKYHDYLPEIKE